MAPTGTSWPECAGAEFTGLNSQSKRMTSLSIAIARISSGSLASISGRRSWPSKEKDTFVATALSGRWRWFRVLMTRASLMMTKKMTSTTVMMRTGPIAMKLTTTISRARTRSIGYATGARMRSSRVGRSNWPRSAALRARRSPDAARNGRSRRVIYSVDVQATLESQHLILDTLLQDLKQDGDWGKPRKQRIPRWQITNLPDAGDRQIFAMLAG